MSLSEENEGREWCHFAMNELVTLDLDAIVAWMWRDPDIRRRIDKPRRPDALRLVIGQFLSRLPADLLSELRREAGERQPESGAEGR